MTDLSRQEIEERIEELGRGVGWFHNIELPGGLFTKRGSIYGEPEDQPRSKWRVLQKSIPENLDGKSVLDIGCNAGFFSFEMAKRGASRVVGIDQVPQYIEQAKFCNEVLGLNCEFRTLSVYDVGTSLESFDIVLCLGVIYHCKHPMLVADGVAAVCREWAIVESALAPRISLFFQEILTKLLWQLYYRRTVCGRYYRKANAFMMMVCNPRSPEVRKDSGANWWFPNMAALKGMFLGAGFDDVKVLHQAFSRGTILCRK